MTVLIERYYDEHGSKVDVYRSDEFADDGCAYCRDGACEQTISCSDDWTRNHVMHDRPVLN